MGNTPSHSAANSGRTTPLNSGSHDGLSTPSSPTRTPPRRNSGKLHSLRKNSGISFRKRFDAQNSHNSHNDASRDTSCNEESDDSKKEKDSHGQGHSRSGSGGLVSSFSRRVKSYGHVGQAHSHGHRSKTPDSTKPGTATPTSSTLHSNSSIQVPMLDNSHSNVNSECNSHNNSKHSSPNNAKKTNSGLQSSQSTNSFSSMRSNHSFHNLHLPHFRFNGFSGHHENSQSWQKLQSLATEPGFKYDMSQFEVIKQIGSGAFGRVLLCKHHMTNMKVVLKQIEKKHVVRTRQQHHLRDERDALKELAENDCPFVVHTVGCFQDKKNIYFVMEYVPGGELFAHLRASTNHHFSEKRTRFYICETILALQHMHEKEHIVYRDIKPENMLLDETGHLKIVDFGFAKHLEVSERTFTFCGTPDYLAPEVIKGHGSGRAADYWALGVLTYELLVGHAPFSTYDDRSGKVTYKEILAGKPKFSKGVNQRAKDFISALLNPDPSKRLGSRTGMNEIKSHEWFSEVDWNAMLRREVKPPKLNKCKKGTVNIQPAITHNKHGRARVSDEFALDDASKEIFEQFDFTLGAEGIVTDCRVSSKGNIYNGAGASAHAIDAIAESAEETANAKAVWDTFNSSHEDMFTNENSPVPMKLTSNTVSADSERTLSKEPSKRSLGRQKSSSSTGVKKRSPLASNSYEFNSYPTAKLRENKDTQIQARSKSSGSARTDVPGAGGMHHSLPSEVKDLAKKSMIAGTHTPSTTLSTTTDQILSNGSAVNEPNSHIGKTEPKANSFGAARNVNINGDVDMEGGLVFGGVAQSGITSGSMTDTRPPSTKLDAGRKEEQLKPLKESQELPKGADAAGVGLHTRVGDPRVATHPPVAKISKVSSTCASQAAAAASGASRPQFFIDEDSDSSL